MQVNFDTGTINTGSLQVASGNQTWDISFEGLLNQGMVELDLVSGQLIDPSGLISDHIRADLGGIFTGAQAEAFVGGFALLDVNNPANFVEGLYTIER